MAGDKDENAKNNDGNVADVKDNAPKGKEELIPKKEYDETRDKMMRLAAEFDNYKKRSLNDVANAKNIGKAEMLKKMMPVIDEFELAIMSLNKSSDENLSNGVKMVYANLIDTLKSEGLEEVEANGKYDPYKSEIIMVKETSDMPPGSVIEVIKKGYTMNGILIRPASVIIAKEPQAEQAETAKKDRADRKSGSENPHGNDKENGKETAE